MLSWTTAYIAAEWVIRIAMLVYVPQRRTPAAARTWLLLVFFWPVVGLVVVPGRREGGRRREGHRHRSRPGIDDRHSSS